MRNVLTTWVIGGTGCGLTVMTAGVTAGVTAGPALAQTAAPAAAGVATATGPVAGPTAGPAWPGHHPRRRLPAGQLWITVRQAPHGLVLRWTLRCGPAGGGLPHPARACARLAIARRPFAPMPHGTVCPMIDYGPQTARISGLWHRIWFTARFSRANGCQETRWSRVMAALGLRGIPGQVNPGGPMQRPPSPGGPRQGQVNPGGPMRPAPPATTH